MATFQSTARRLAAAAAAVSGTYMLLRPWHLRWGATDEEASLPLPGDEFVPLPRTESTRAISIQAPPSAIWPWIVQIGQGRGGFYSYEALENIAGCDIHNAERVVPAWQQIQIGDKVRLGPEGYPYFTVAAFEPERILVLRAADPQTGAPGEGSWVFALQPVDAETTRLVVRSRNSMPLFWQLVTEPTHFLMERRMLQGIKARAERSLAETLLNRCLPVFDEIDFCERLVAADAATSYAAVRDLAALTARDPLLHSLDMLPTALTEAFAQHLPFVVLAEQAGTEVVFGLVGRFWEREADFLRIEPAEFAAFATPGYAKLALNIAVRPWGAGGTLLSSEWRIVATDAETRAKFGRTWRAARLGIRLVMKRLLALAETEAERIAAAGMRA